MDAYVLRENVMDGKMGFVVSRRRPGKLAEKLATLAGESDARLQMGSASRQRVVAKFGVGDQIRSFDQFYRDA